MEKNATPASRKSQRPKLLDEVHQCLRIHHYSIRTERFYVDWITQFVRLHHMHSREDPFRPELKIKAFLTHLAVDKNVAPATQNQAMNSWVFLYKRVLKQAMDGAINAVRADGKASTPVVISTVSACLE